MAVFFNDKLQVANYKLWVSKNLRGAGGHRRSGVPTIPFDGASVGDGFPVPLQRKNEGFFGRGGKCRRTAGFRHLGKMKMGKKWEDFSLKVWYNANVVSWR